MNSYPAVAAVSTYQRPTRQPSVIEYDHKPLLSPKQIAQQHQQRVSKPQTTYPEPIYQPAYLEKYRPQAEPSPPPTSVSSSNPHSYYEDEKAYPAVTVNYASLTSDLEKGISAPQVQHHENVAPRVNYNTYDTNRSLVANTRAPLPPTPALRKVLKESICLMGGLTALLLQIAHPGVGAGVAFHSDFVYRAFQRMENTAIYIYGIVFGTEEEKRAIQDWVDKMHAPVKGERGGVQYDAKDPDLQLWVAATIYVAMVGMYEAV
jgi:hypothetical protein